MTTPAFTPDAYPIPDQAQVKLDGSGNGTAVITPGQAGAPGSGVGAARNSGLLWNVTGVSVSASSSASDAKASVFISYGILSSTQADFLGQTATGSSGDTCSVNVSLKPGDWITVKWTGGTPGAIATMRVTGTITPPGMS